LKDEFFAQMRNMRHEMRLYKGFGHQGNRRRLVPSLKFVPRFSVLKRPTCTMFWTHSTHSVPYSQGEKESNDLRLAARLSQMFFGNVLEGQACSTCFRTYREPFPTDCSGWENRFRDGCDTLRTRFIKSLKPSQLYRVLCLVVAKFLSSYDIFAIQSGLRNLSDCWFDPYKFQGHKQFSRFLNVLSAFASGMAECHKSRILQIELRRCFSSLHTFRWNPKASDEPKFAEWFLDNSDKHELLAYFGLASNVKIHCFDFDTILNEMVSRRQDRLRELAEEPLIFACILGTLAKLETISLRQALGRAIDMIASWEGLEYGGIYRAIQIQGFW
jgi:hypothetical protein